MVQAVDDALLNPSLSFAPNDDSLVSGDGPPVIEERRYCALSADVIRISGGTTDFYSSP